MAYDEELAYRIRALLATECRVEEKPMFGGLAFLIQGNMVVAGGQDDIMVRVPPEQTTDLLEYPHTEPVVMSGREIRGWLRVCEDGIATDRQLSRWVAIGADYARKLPPK